VLAGGRIVKEEETDEVAPGFRGPNSTVPGDLEVAARQNTVLAIDKEASKKAPVPAPKPPAATGGGDAGGPPVERPRHEVNVRDTFEAPAGGKIAAGAVAPGAADLKQKEAVIGAILPESAAADREAYDRIRDNPFVRVADEDTSTFSIDVDTASYANVRRFLQQQHRLPPPDAVRVEEMINYFSYAYEPPAAGSPHPFRIHVEVATCPWEKAHRLARVAIKGKAIDRRERPDSNLVFLVDVSGSMDQPDKLPLVLASLRMLAENLGERDRVAIAVYAGAAGLVLPSTGDKQQVIDALARLKAGGSTAGAAGIVLAYQVAAENFIKGGTNRVILCTDGDFNVGISDDGSLTRLIEEKAKTGVFLSVLGFGTGNYQDSKMQQLADKGNGNHAYIDSILEARKVLGEEMSGTLVTIAMDVKIQLFFNPRTVAGYRLIGYENRLLRKQDFNDDTKDAGEIGAGHCVTALYEIVPAGGEVPAAVPADENPFLAKPAAGAGSDALFQLRLRYKQPDGDKSELLEQTVSDGDGSFDRATPDFRWAASVAAFGMNLRGTAGMGLEAVLEIAKGAAGDDKYRREFLELVAAAKLLKR
jgi:Ca-activated chloride channel family protein